MNKYRLTNDPLDRTFGNRTVELSRAQQRSVVGGERIGVMPDLLEDRRRKAPPVIEREDGEPCKVSCL